MSISDSRYSIFYEAFWKKIPMIWNLQWSISNCICKQLLVDKNDNLWPRSAGQTVMNKQSNFIFALLHQNIHTICFQQENILSLLLNSDSNNSYAPSFFSDSVSKLDWRILLYLKSHFPKIVRRGITSYFAQRNYRSLANKFYDARSGFQVNFAQDKPSHHVVNANEKYWSDLSSCVKLDVG